MKLNSGKDIIKSIKNTVPKQVGTIDDIEIKAASLKLHSVIKEISKEYNNQIPYSILKEKLGLSFELIQETIMTMLVKRQLIGFVNDKSTSDLSDDVLMLRDERIVDNIEPKYYTV